MVPRLGRGRRPGPRRARPGWVERVEEDAVTVRFETLTARPVPPATCRPATLIVTRLAWEFLEGGLLLRDRALGKGSTEQDRGTRRLAVGLGVVAIAGRQCVLGFFFVNPR